MKIPSAHEAVKSAGMADIGTAAMIGALLSGIAGKIPAIAEVRQTNPALYDAALAATAFRVMEQLEAHEMPHDQSLVPMRAV